MTTETAPFVAFPNFPPKAAQKVRFQHRRLVSEAVARSLGEDAFVIGVSPKEEQDRYVLLVFVPSNIATPFVTHLCEVGTEEAALFWGRYETGIEEAVKALTTR